MWYCLQFLVSNIFWLRLLSLCISQLITYADSTAFYLSVYLHAVSKINAARVTKVDVQMFHDDSFKPIYFGIKRPKIKVSHKNRDCMGLCSLVSAGFHLWLAVNGVCEETFDCYCLLCSWRRELMWQLSWRLTDYIVNCLHWGSRGITFSASSNDESSLEPSTLSDHGTQLR